jgi:hypothetical protein
MRPGSIRVIVLLLSTQWSVGHAVQPCSAAMQCHHATGHATGAVACRWSRLWVVHAPCAMGWRYFSVATTQSCGRNKWLNTPRVGPTTAPSPEVSRQQSVPRTARMHGCTISQKLNLFHPTHGLAHALDMITDICLAAWQINAGLSQPTVWRWI